MKQQQKPEWVGYLYVTTFRQDGRVYAHQNSVEGASATQAVKEHNGAMTFFWCHGTDGIVSDLYNHRGEIIRHGARQGQPRPATYQATAMPSDIAAHLTTL